MADNRNCMSDRDKKENFGIDVNRILDSCRDKDCFSNVKVYLSDCGQELIERASNVRIKYAEIISADISAEPVQFNRGFYSVFIRFYVKIITEICVCPGKVQEVEGMSVLDKKVILYGSEGGVSVFRSTSEDGFCTCGNGNNEGGNLQPDSNLPIAVCEVASPVVLDARIVDKENDSCKITCCCSIGDIPQSICNSCGCLCDTDTGEKMLVVSIGIFSVVRIERPTQIIVSGIEYSVPDKECCSVEESDPCTAFKCMSFPVNEFSPPTFRNLC